MTEHYRGSAHEEDPIDRWFRGRWEYGSVYVMNFDKVICDPAAKNGVIFELKHLGAEDKTWSVTRTVARSLGWWSGLIEHDGCEPRFRTLMPPKGFMLERRPFDERRFDEWICANFGARKAA